MVLKVFLIWSSYAQSSSIYILTNAVNDLMKSFNEEKSLPLGENCIYYKKIVHKRNLSSEKVFPLSIDFQFQCYCFFVLFVLCKFNFHAFKDLNTFCSPLKNKSTLCLYFITNRKSSYITAIKRNCINKWLSVLLRGIFIHWNVSCTSQSTSHHHH